MVDYPCSIIANPEGGAWNFAYSIWQNLNARDKKYELNYVDVAKFGDGEIKPKIRNNIRRRNCFFIHDSGLNPADWKLQLDLVNETLRNSSAQEIIDVLPYLKFARQDRKDVSRVPVSTRVVAKSIDRYANRVLTLDVHNPAIINAYDIPFDNLYSFATVIDYLNKNYSGFFENIVIMSPDVGGAKRMRSFAKRAGVKRMAIGDKNREDDGEVESIQIIGDVKGRNVLLVDDIVDSGMTLTQCSRAAKLRGANKVYAYAPHGLFTKGLDELASCLEMIIVGDSVPQKLTHDKLKQVSFVPLFAETIYRINEGKSLSELFD